MVSRSNEASMMLLETKPTASKSKAATAASTQPPVKKARKITSLEDNDAPSITKPKKQKERIYTPAYQSGGYAILVALYKHAGTTQHMSKSQITEKAQEYCAKSFLVPTDASYYTAWSSMATLLKHDLVFKHGNPPRFSLSDTGKEVAGRFVEIETKGFQCLSSSDDEEAVHPVTADKKGKQPMQKPKTVVPSFEQPASEVDKFLGDCKLNRQDPSQMAPPGLQEYLNRQSPKPHLQTTFYPETKSKSLLSPTAHIKVPKASPNRSTNVLRKGTFNIILVLDNREVRTQKDRTLI
jgi:crossover junction endonuclease MUS81